MSSLTSLNRPISPPPKASRSKPKENTSDKNGPRPAAVEAGEVHIEDHLAYSSNHLRKVLRLTVTSIPRLSIDQFVQLYQRNQTSNGHHFIIHQHDHPVSGVHYDLRLQFSDSSSISFAVPYGMPGDANSRRQLRMAIETRVHNLWNHLIESASHATGSLLIWNIGEYEILPKQAENAVETDDENSEKDDASSGDQDSREEPTKLLEAFKARHMRLRLHGTKLPKNYTINLRLPSANDYPATKSGRKPRKRRRKVLVPTNSPTDYSTDDEATIRRGNGPTVSPIRSPSKPSSIVTRDGDVPDEASASPAAPDVLSDEDEDDQIRASNAYPGATNSIGSVHQRRWVLTLDRPASGFVKVRKGAEKGRWVRAPGPKAGRREGVSRSGGGDEGGLDGERGGWEPFYVRGRDEEKSVVTGRLAMEIMDDEGVKGYAGRKMWMPILE